MHGRQGYGPASRLPERWVRVGPGGRWAGFTLFGFVGLVAAMGWTFAVAVAAGRPAWLVLVLAGAMVGALLAVAAGEALVAGRARLVCFHAETAALVVAAGVLALARQPVLASLDVAAPGLAVFLAGGRVGCLVAGCCHGRPAARGVRYGARHVAEGLPVEYAGVTLLPVPALEAGALVAMAAATTAVVLGPAPAGAALTSYLLAHVAVRFWLELLRGDPGRPYLAGLSEAQWTALAVVVAACLAVAAGWRAVPAGPASAAAVAVIAGVALIAARAEQERLRRPAHALAVARLVRGADAVRGGLVTATTPLGVRMSASHRDVGRGGVPC
ncbi:MAG TPA: prolipoprotein diacylglyceryl transferase family protein, partial [Acidimicrobiales bacterium]|nr:prolipoprotein diacylglyceryl transferase family protein [Acidimicrobiales bacterium]